MGAKYTTQASSGYNATPPADDGTVSEANRTKWSTVKTKIGDPLKVFVEAINTALVAAFNYGPNSQGADYSAVLGDNDKTIEVTAAATITLLAAATAGAGYRISITNSHSAAITIAGGISGSLESGGSVTFQVNAAASAYLVLSRGYGSVAALTFSNLTITGGTINGAVIGGASPAAITGTAIAGTTGTFSGDVAVNGGDLTTSASTFNLVNATATTVNIAGGATSGVFIGNGSGTVAIAGPVSLAAGLVADGDVAVNGGDMTTTATTFNLVNATATTVNLAGGATVALNIGNGLGATSILGSSLTVVNGPLIAEAPTTSIPSVRLPHGTAPSSPTNGDMWTTTAGLFVRINGVTVGPLS